MRTITVLSVVILLPFSAIAGNNNPEIFHESSGNKKLVGKSSHNKLVISHWLKSDSMEGIVSVLTEHEKTDSHHGIGSYKAEIHPKFDFGFVTTREHNFSWGEDWDGFFKTRFKGNENFSHMHSIKHLFENKNHFLKPGCTPPIPEASAWQMMFAGLALIGFVSRRRLGFSKK